jgi:hypothetical protein
MVSNLSFFNGCFDKGRLKSLISWSLINCGEQFTIELVENLKNLGFEYATQAGVSLSLDDLKIPPTKAQLVSEAELQIISANTQYQRGNLTAVEKFQQLIDTWHRTSETLKQNVIQYFRATDILNPVYMMAFSGARGNVSQVRQLVGMRGLMADPQGQIIDFPIRSNFREGLTLTEYIISCYGARKGLVDTALRTANSGYLTRRLVDVSQHVIVCQFDCGTQRGIFLNDMTEGQKVLLSLQNRLLGRVLAENIYVGRSPGKEPGFNEVNKTPGFPTRATLLAKQSFNSLNSQSNIKEDSNFIFTTKNSPLIKKLSRPKLVDVSLLPNNLVATKGQEISATLAEKISKLRTQVLVRSPLTCEAKRSICQLCYGWSLAHGNLVSLGEAVGILAAQSIGEPGTQLTMRTFHTGGVFSGDLMTEIRAPFDGVIQFTEFLPGILIRTPHGKIAFLTKIQGEFSIKAFKFKIKDPGSLPFLPMQEQWGLRERKKLVETDGLRLKQEFKIPASTILFVRQGEFVREKQLIAEFSSISTQTNQRIQAKHNLNSEMEGQVFFENVVLKVYENKEGDITRIAKKLGSIWILSGKIYQTMVPTSFFPKVCDLIDSSSVINQVLVVSRYTGFLAKNNFQNVENLNRIEDFTLGNKKEILAAFAPAKGQGANLQKMSTSNLLQNAVSFYDRKNLSLSCPLLSFSIKAISYYQMGYFFTLWPNEQQYFHSGYPAALVFGKEGITSRPDRWLYSTTKRLPTSPRRSPGREPGLHSDLFFLSTSLNQEIHNSVDLKNLLYLQNFSKNYKTKTGGVLFYDSLYLDSNHGQIFWVPEESYKFNPKSFFVPTQAGFTLFPFFLANKIKLDNFYKKFSKKWITKNFPILSKYNSQGKIINFSSKMSGWLQIKHNKNLNVSTEINIKSQVPFSNVEIANSFLNFGSLICKSDELKILFSKQFFSLKNTAISSIKNNSCCFRRNPYVLIRQKPRNHYKLLSQKNKYPTQFSKIQKIVNGKINFMELSWFSQFRGYTCNKTFLHQERFTKLESRTPFVNSQLSFVNKNLIPNKFQSDTSSKFFNQQVSKIKYPQGSEDFFSDHGSFEKNRGFKIESQIRPGSSALPWSLCQGNEKSINTNLLEIRIKSGWVYFPRNKNDVLNYHKQILKPGFSFIDNIEFDQHIIYLECISIPFLSIESFKCYFTPFQVKEKNVFLELKLNFKELIKEFSLDFFQINRSSYNFSNDTTYPGVQNQGKQEPILRVFSKKHHRSPGREPGCKNLNLFLFKLNKFRVLNKIVLNKNPIEWYRFTREEMNFIKYGIPHYLEIGLHLKFFSDKIYYIKNKNYRYFEPGFPTPSRGDGARAPLAIARAMGTTTLEKKNENLTRVPSSGYDKWFFPKKLEKTSSFYLAKSYLNFKKKNSIVSFKNRSIIQLSVLNPNFFGFQSLLPEQFLNQAVSTKADELNTNFFTPSFFILIRKVNQYSVFKPKYYKQLISKNNQKGLNNYVFQSSNDRRLLTNLTWFNKQVRTTLFSSSPSAAFEIRSSFRFRNSQQMFFTKELNIVEFFILVNIPKKFPFKRAKVTFLSKQTFLPANWFKLRSLISTKTPLSLSKLITITKQKDLKSQYVAPTALAVARGALAPSPRDGVGNPGSMTNQAFLSNISQDRSPVCISGFWTPGLNLKHQFSKNYRNKLCRHVDSLSRTKCIEVTLFHKIDNSSFMGRSPGREPGSELKNNIRKFTNTKLVLHPQNYIFANNPLSLIDFFSPYQGEITDIKIDSLGKQSCFILTEKDQISFSTEKNIPFTFVGKLIRYGEQIAENISIPNSGQIIQVDKSKVILRKAHSILFSSKGVFYVHHGDFVEKNSPLLTLFYQRLKTGDIVQGIPKIEQLFEARQTKEGEILPENLHEKLHNFFKKYKQKYSPRDAARKSLEKTQQLLVDGVQRVYQSQGVTIADKHLEVIVRQMTSKVKIIEGGHSGFLRGELIDLDRIEMVNNGISSQKAEYEPVILGITKAALETESFISAASFQETTRILARAAIERKTDFLRGLKENVILGHLIPAGTGFSLSFDTQSLDYSKKTENVKFFRKLFLGLHQNDN